MFYVTTFFTIGTVEVQERATRAEADRLAYVNRSYKGVDKVYVTDYKPAGTESPKVTYIAL